MNKVVNLAAFRKEKRLKYEREMLKDFSLELLGRQYRHLAKGLKCFPGYSIEPAEEHCYDIAVEGFLLGGYYSKFNRYGESPERIKERAQKEIDLLSNQLFYYLYQSKDEDSSFIQETLRSLTDEYVLAWWMEGYSKGINRYKMRMK